MSQLHKVTSRGNYSVKMYNNIVFSPVYTIYSLVFIFYFGCFCIVKCRNALKIVILLKQLSYCPIIKRPARTLVCIWEKQPPDLHFLFAIASQPQGEFFSYFAGVCSSPGKFF